MCGGACVCCFSRTKKCVTLSTSEAEYIALDNAVNELLFLRQVYRFMIPGKGMPCFSVFEDNQGASQLSKNPVSNLNSTHIDVRHNFLRELIRQGGIKVNYGPSQYQHVFDGHTHSLGSTGRGCQSCSWSAEKRKTNIYLFVPVCAWKFRLARRVWPSRPA